MNITAIIQARMGSSRLPGKVLMEIFPGISILSIMIQRLKLSKLVNKFVVATTSLVEDSMIERECEKLGVFCIRSAAEESDVLGRFVETAKKCEAELIVRICADSPLHDSEIMDTCIDTFFRNERELDLVTNFKPETFPYGTAVEVFPLDVLLRLDRLSIKPETREHVTQFFHQNPNLFKFTNVSNNVDFSALKWAVDTSEDLERVRSIFFSIGQENRTQSWRKIAELNCA